MPRTDIDNEKIKKLYLDGWTLQAIADANKTSGRLIANRLIKIGVERRGYSNRYNVRRNSALLEKLSKWTPESAYVFGYAIADGSIGDSQPSSKSIEFVCATKDKDLIYQVAKFLGVEDDLQHRMSTGFSRRTPIVRLRLYGNAIVKALEDKGMRVRKTWLNYRLPPVPKEMLPHYVRGQFDGNGCASLSSKGSVGFTASRAFITSLRNTLCSLLGMHVTKVQARPGHSAVVWTRKEDVQRLYEFLYPRNDVMHLKRKRLNMKVIAYGSR